MKLVAALALGLLVTINVFAGVRSDGDLKNIDTLTSQCILGDSCEIERMDW